MTTVFGVGMSRVLTYAPTTSREHYRELTIAMDILAWKTFSTLDNTAGNMHMHASQEWNKAQKTCRHG